MRPGLDCLFIFVELHFDSPNRGAAVARLDGQAWIIQRANARGLREPVGLQHWDAEHQEKLLRLRSERRGTADQRTQVWSKARANLSKDERTPEREPERVERTAAADVLPLPAAPSFRKQGTDHRRPPAHCFLHAATNTLE